MTSHLIQKTSRDTECTLPPKATMVAPSTRESRTFLLTILAKNLTCLICLTRKKSVLQRSEEGSPLVRAQAPNGNLVAKSDWSLTGLAAGASLQTLMGATKTATKAANRLSATLASKLVVAPAASPLEKEKGDREHTRRQVREDLKKWEPFLKERKKAKQLSFPLNAPNHSAVPATLGGVAHSDGAKKKRAKKESDGRTPVPDVKPALEDSRPSTTAKERIDELLLQSGLSRATKKEKQDGAQPAASNEEEEGFIELGHDADNGGEASPAPTIGYVSKLKSMLAYEIVKRRRLNHIKSKTYRRILRKEKEREADKRQQALALLNPEAAKKKLQQRIEKLRAEERATQRHKNTSKWVKHVKRFTKFDSDTRDALQEQEVEHQKLLQKMAEPADEEMKVAADDVSESTEEEQRVDELLQGAPGSSVLWADPVKQGEEVATPKDPISKARGELQQMSFMKRARDQHDAQMQQELADLEEDIERYKQGKEPIHADDNAGKQTHRDADEEINAEVQREDAAEEETPHPVDAAPVAKPVKAQRSSETTGGRKKFGVLEEGGKRKRESVVTSLKYKGQGIVPKSLQERLEEERVKANETAPPSEPNATLEATTAGAVEAPREEDTPDAPTVGKPTKRCRVVAPQAAVPDLPTQPSAPVEVHDGTVEQEYLVSRAFAKDEIDEDFLKQKEQQVDSVLKPQDKNASLPGWGEWGGESERLNRQHKQRVEQLAFQRNVERSTMMKARADALLDNVIINHDVDLVPEKYTLHMVPRPFANATEYHRAMRQPLGPEWNTASTFREGVEPKIVTKPGTIIEPLDKLSMQRERAKTTRRKKK